jgi:hypothetical protein
MAHNKWERFIDDLTADEIQILSAALESEKPINVKIIDTWEDDHLDCAGCVINGVECAFWWISPKQVGALTYSDSPKAQRELRNMVAHGIETWRYENE